MQGHERNTTTITATASGDIRLTDTRGAAHYTQMSEAYLRKARRHGRGPKFVRVGSKSVRYRVCDLDSWINAQLVG